MGKPKFVVVQRVEVSNPECGPMPGDVFDSVVMGFDTQEEAQKFISIQRSPKTFRVCDYNDEEHGWALSPYCALHQGPTSECSCDEGGW